VRSRSGPAAAEASKLLDSGELEPDVLDPTTPRYSKAAESDGVDTVAAVPAA
jgi:hypothetical protein